MSFRTDGFEPSAYTIPPPRQGAGIQRQLKARNILPRCGWS